MNIARFSVTRPVTVTMRIASLVLLGFVTLQKLPVDLLPKVSLPTVVVITTWPNTAPEPMETEITRPIEQAVNSAPNVYQVNSTTTTGSSLVQVQFNWGTNIGQAAVDVLQQVQRARQNFPTDPTLQNPIVFKYDPSQLPILIYGVTGINDPVKLRTLLDNTISPMLESAGGVASAVATGGEQRALIVDVHPEKLQAYHLSLNQISTRIIQENLDLPSGIAREGNSEFTIRADGNFTSPADAAAIPIASFNGRLVSLGDVATVTDSHQETRIYTRLNGKPAAGMIIVQQSDANTIQTAANVAAKIQQIHKIYPELKFDLAYDQSQFIKSSVANVRDSALIGGVLAALILLFFLRSFRSTLVVALSIPISIISTFALFYLFGFTINTISLSALSLATGLIVDDAVVVLENIFRHIERDGRPPRTAAETGTNEITSAVLASTFTVMIVFLPLMLLNGQAGQLFTQFALVVIFSLAISLLDALTVVPMLASRFIHRDEIEHENQRHSLHTLAHQAEIEQEEHASIPPHTGGIIQRAFDWFGDRFDALDDSYHNGLKWALNHRALVLLGAGAITASTLLLAPYIGTEMLPQTDNGNINMTVKMPPGTALAVTNATMKKVEKILLSDPNVGTIFSSAGTTLNIRGATTQNIAYEGSATIRLKNNRPLTTVQTIQELQAKLNKLPGARFILFPYDIVNLILTGGPSNVEADIFGNNLQTLNQLGNTILSKARRIPGFESADLNIQEATPELRWKVDRNKMLQLGVTYANIASALDTATNGQLSSYYQRNGFQYPIYVQEPQSQRKTIAELDRLPVTPSAAANGPSPHQVLLGQVATPYFAFGPNEITRQNNQRYIAISGSVLGRSQSGVEADLKKLMDSYHLPQGYYWTFGPAEQRQKNEFAGMSLALFLAIALIYMLLAAQFESFTHPLSIMMAVPLTAIGVAFALFLTGRAFGLTAFIGLLMLVGIAVKNGILLVDYTNQLRARGTPRNTAVLIAGPTRLRPILMTACAAIFGMLPLAIGIGEGSETQAPLATAVIGGLFTSTLLTLFVVPVVYTILDDIGLMYSGRKGNAPITEEEQP